MSCLFCDIDNNPDHNIVFRQESVLFIQSEKYQGALEHSGLIIPASHRETVFDLTPEEVTATFELLLKVKRYMDGEFEPDGYNVGWNCGEIGGQHVFHAHMHVIPRFKEEPLAGTGIRTYLKSEANARS